MLDRRQLIGELMDDPALPEAEHRLALNGLRRINSVSCTSRSLFKHLLPLLGTDPKQPRRVLDVACGDGDNTLRLAWLAAAQGLDWDVSGCDLSERSVAYARQLAEERGIDATFFQADALGSLETGAYDAVVNSLFLHHLEDEAIIRFLRNLREARHVVISDLIRSTRAYATTWLGVRLLSRSKVVHVDGPLSVRAALTRRELNALAEQAGLTGATVGRAWPMRQVLVWSQST